MKRILTAFLAAVARPRFICGVCHESRRSIALLDAHIYVDHGDLS